MRRIVRHHSTPGALDKMRRFLPVASIERDDQIGAAEYFLVAAQIERMAIGKIEPCMDIEYGGADGLGQRHEMAEAACAAPDIFGHQHRIVRGQETLGDGGERRRIRRHRRRRFAVRGLRQRDVARQRLLLQPGVVAHIDRALRLGHHRGIGARKRIRHAFDARRLIVPFDVMAKLLAIDIGGVDPVDERAAPALVHRAGGTDDKDRTAIEIGVVDSHGGMQHADHVVNDRHHRLAGRLGVAMRDLHRDLLMLTQQ